MKYLKQIHSPTPSIYAWPRKDKGGAGVWGNSISLRPSVAGQSQRVPGMSDMSVGEGGGAV